ncbi:hypothetical protein [Streptomyces sp. NPDC057623]|uniref:hypothetical protein n=1 Tax=Streptomyces sp. NPDC057623 TaxID=3346187 RepID=UPI0036A72337
MSTASTARCRSRSRAWLRVLVLLLALLVPGAHAQAHALPVVTGASGASGSGSGSGSGEIAEHDALDPALRPPARGDRRGTVRPARPGTGSLPEAARGVRACGRHSAPPRAPYVSHILRTVVLRC